MFFPTGEEGEGDEEGERDVVDETISHASVAAPILEGSRGGGGGVDGVGVGDDDAEEEEEKNRKRRRRKRESLSKSRRENR